MPAPSTLPRTRSWRFRQAVTSPDPVDPFASVADGADPSLEDSDDGAEGAVDDPPVELELPAAVGESLAPVEDGLPPVLEGAGDPVDALVGAA